MSIAKVESDFNPRVRTGSYKGLFQLSDYEFKKYGDGSIWDARDNARAAAHMFLVQAEKFRWALGHYPDYAERYMVHQQGIQGAIEHYTVVMFFDAAVRFACPGLADDVEVGEPVFCLDAENAIIVAEINPGKVRYHRYAHRSFEPGGARRVKYYRRRKLALHAGIHRGLQNCSSSGL
jgi:hypothetical protein